MDLTILELHFPNAEFNAPYANSRQPQPEEDHEHQSQELDSESSVLPGLFLLLVLGTAALAYFIRNKQHEPTTDRSV